ncbi:MAG TPA: sigma 54-interacting transcriptional regulator [Terracidiphilus sp.]|nr:sigma 54-interacting transcriptional regulator [Terracidiphilus sp.]
MRPSNSPEQDAAAQAQARQNRAEFARIAIENHFAISPDAILVTDASGVIREANPRATELFGYTRGELIGMPLDNLVPERFRERHPRHRENFNAHPRTRQMGASLNLFALRKDGSEFPVDIMLRPIGTASGPVTISFVRDITEQRAALEELRKQDLQLRTIVEAVHDFAIYMLDRDGHVVTWNVGGERIHGYTAEEILGKHFARFFEQRDQDRGHPRELLERAAEHGTHEEEGWRVRKDGSRFWAQSVLTAIHDAAGEVTAFAKVTRDHTDRKRAEEAVMLQLSAALLENMDTRKLLEAFSASIGAVIPHDAATLGMFDEARNAMLVQFLGRRDEKGTRRADLRVPIEGSPSGASFRSREPVILERLPDPNFAAESVAHLTGIGMRSACWVPLLYRGEPIGYLAVASRTEGAFGTRDAEVLAEFADQMAMAVNNAVAFRQVAELRDRLSQEKQYLEEEINLENQFEDIVGESAGLKRVLSQIETVAPTDATVLIQGETGTGKELLARSIHRLSGRSERTFIKLNCAAIPAALLESELFGHEKGAFTGAIARKMGRLELAHEGTLFLDEVGEMPLELQPKLLRALQEREIERLGGTRPIAVNVRLIAATNRDLARMVEEKTFRADLFYRLKVFPISAPPLRERKSDIPVLVRHFVAAHSRRMGKTIETIPDATMDALMEWKWPGNIRELENLLERAVILTRGPVLYVPLAELELPLEEDEPEGEETVTLHSAEREHILKVLRECKGIIGGAGGAAERLGLKRTTLNSKMKKLKIARGEYI